MSKKSTREAGFTIVELLIGIVIASILALAIVNLFTSQQQAYSVQEQVTEAQQSARSAIDMLTREIRGAGSGVPKTYLTSAYTSGTTLTVASACGFSTGDVINITDSNNNSEAATIAAIPTSCAAGGTTITITSPFANSYNKRSGVSLEKVSVATENSITFKSDIGSSGTILTVNYTSGTTLTVDSNSGFSNGDTIYINDGGRWETQTVSSTSSSDTINLSSTLSNNYPRDTRVNLLDTVAYDFNSNTVRRSLNGGSAQPLADHTAYIEYRYYDKDDALLDNSNPYTGVALSATERSQIRRIKVQVIVRTAREDPNWTESGTYGDGTAYNDGYHRVLLETDIKLRNLGY